MSGLLRVRCAGLRKGTSRSTVARGGAMRGSTRWLLVVVVVGSAVHVPPAAAQIRFAADRDSGPGGSPRAAAGLLVQFRPGVLEADQSGVIADAGGRLALRLRLVRA